MIVLKWLAIGIALVYLGGVAVLYVRQREMLFPIPPVGRTAPAAAGLPQAEEHVLTTADGEKVIVWHIPPKPGHAVVLFFHGNGDFLAGRVRRFEGITSDGTGLVALSFRGYAGSTGSPSEQGLLQDAAAAYAFTTARYAADSIVVWGFSLGTGVAVALASEQPIGKLILEAPYTSTVDVASSMLRVRAGQPVDARSLPLGSEDCAGQGAVAHHAWRKRSRHSHQVWRAPVRAGQRAQAIRPLSRRRPRQSR